MCNDPNCGENSCDCSHANCPCRTTTPTVEMTDAEKIEWLTATNNALIESQERLASEVKELRKLAYFGDHHFPDLTWKARFNEVLEENTKLRKLLRHFFGNGGGIPYTQWTREQHAAYDLLQKDK